INNNGDAPRGRSNNQSSDRPDLKTSDLRKDIERIVWIGLMAMDRLSDEICLMAHPFVIHARTSPDDLFNRQAGNHGEYCRTGCGIPNAHFARSNQIVSLGAIHSGLNGTNRLTLRHRRMLGEVLGAPAYFLRNEAGPLLEVVIDADIDDNALDAVMTAQDIDGSTFAQEVENHLCGHFAGIGANACTRYSMVGRKREDRLPIQNEIH